MTRASEKTRKIARKHRLREHKLEARRRAERPALVSGAPARAASARPSAATQRPAAPVTRPPARPAGTAPAGPSTRPPARVPLAPPALLEALVGPPSLGRQRHDRPARRWDSLGEPGTGLVAESSSTAPSTGNRKGLGGIPEPLGVSQRSRLALPAAGGTKLAGSPTVHRPSDERFRCIELALDPALEAVEPAPELVVPHPQSSASSS